MANRAYKGRRFEIWLANRLSLWWTNGERDDVFWHTHDSGGRATRRAVKGKSTKGLHGDICAVDLLGQPLLDLVTIEAKRGYPGTSLQDLLDKPEGKRGTAGNNYFDWIEKAITSSEAAASLHWMLVTRRDQRQVLTLVPVSLIDNLRGHTNGDWIERYANSFNHKLSSLSCRSCSNERIWVFLLEDFLSITTPKHIQQLCHALLSKFEG